MEVVESKLTPPVEFPFPYTAYSIQDEFMRALFVALEGKKLAVFESPTGTGKSMSLLCGSLRWLFDHQTRRKQDLMSAIDKFDMEMKSAPSSADWLEEQSSVIEARCKKQEAQQQLDLIKKHEERIKEIKTQAQQLKADKKVKAMDFGEGRKTGEVEKGLSNEVEEDDDLLNEFQGRFKVTKDEDEEIIEELEDNGTKIFFCSRTHSQLSQLVGQLKLSPYNKLGVRVATLASRLNLCVNENVLKLKSLPLINEKCLELKDKRVKTQIEASSDGCKRRKTQTCAACPFYQKDKIEEVKVNILTQVRDIEETVALGRTLGGCPYYAARRSIKEAQIVLLPYNTLLHAKTRESCGVDLMNNIVIIDEAHNLTDTIASIHGAFITNSQLRAGKSALEDYTTKYQERFNAYSVLHLKQLVSILKRLIRRTIYKDDEENKAYTMVSTADLFAAETQIDNININKLLEFIEGANLVRKVQGFLRRKKLNPEVKIDNKEAGVEETGVKAFLQRMKANKTTKNGQKSQENGKLEKEDLTAEVKKNEERVEGNPISILVNFLQSLIEAGDSSRVLVTLGGDSQTRKDKRTKGSLKVFLLNPAEHFADIVKQARAVILAGGTMEPMSEFTQLLFPLARGQLDRITSFACGHVVSGSQILPLVLSQGPTGRSLSFNFETRKTPALLDELGRVLVNVSSVAPGGVVVFFVSYDQMDCVYQHFERSGLLQGLSKRKTVLREPRMATELDNVMQQYGKEVKRRGAVLFSVVGGKLSEGLNFNDDLARCVVLVGLPYPNNQSLELKQKMNYLEASVGPGAGRTYYQNLCLKAVNQSIGRAVRHAADYAAVLLLDPRYSQPSVLAGLSAWLRPSLKVVEGFPAAVRELAGFYKAMAQSR